MALGGKGLSGPGSFQGSVLPLLEDPHSLVAAGEALLAPQANSSSWKGIKAGLLSFQMVHWHLE